jgi:hypothetical protein
MSEDRPTYDGAIPPPVTGTQVPPVAQYEATLPSEVLPPKWVLASMYKLKNMPKPYMPAASRIQWFRSVHFDWTVETEVVDWGIGPDGLACVRAVIRTVDGRIIATGHKTEARRDFPEPVEKAETGAVSRALINAGFGYIGETDHTESGTEPVNGSGSGNAPADNGGGVWGGPGQCMSCHAPAGKPHTSKCTYVAPVAAAAPAVDTAAVNVALGNLLAALVQRGVNHADNVGRRRLGWLALGRIIPTNMKAMPIADIDKLTAKAIELGDSLSTAWNDAGIDKLMKPGAAG